MLRLLRRARGRPRPRRQAAAARPDAVARRAPGRAVLAGPARHRRAGPGWHIECATIALDTIGMGFDVQGGGSDLVFPHHEYSAVHAEALTATKPFARAYVHAAMIGLDGEKMSKSRGNLVFVSKLRGDGVDPMAIRLALLSGHYRTDRAWTADLLTHGRGAAGHLAPGGRPGRRRPRRRRCCAGLRERLADDLDSPGAIALVDAWAGADPRRRRRTPRTRRRASSCDAVDALLGVALRGLRMTRRAVPASPTGPRASAAEEQLAPAATRAARRPRPGATRARGPAADGVRARPRPDPARQGLPPAQAQDAGLPEPRRRPLRHPADPHAAGHPGRPVAGPGARPQRDAGRGDRAGPRRRPLAVRPPRRGRARALRARAAGTTPRRACGSSRCSST